MSYEYLAAALSISDSLLKNRVDQAQMKLEAIPETYYGLFWLYTHDYLYISKSIEQVLGHPYEKFKHRGLIFLQTIIPPGHMSFIYNSLQAQALQIENSPQYLFTKRFLSLRAAVYNVEMQEVPVSYNGLLLDVKPFEPKSYLVLGSWINIADKKEEEVTIIEKNVKELLLEIIDSYIASKPEHFEILLAGKKISGREKEVASLLMRGHSTKIISDYLQISFNTVESHRKSLLKKMRSKNTAELINKLNSISF